MPIWARLLGTAAAARVAIGLALYLSGQVDTSTPSPIPAWAYALLSASFGFVGGVLAITHERDERASWLGGVLLLLAVPLTGLLLAPDLSPALQALVRVRPDTFLPAFLWFFVAAFPSPLTGHAARVAAAIAAVLTLQGVVAFAGTASTVVWPLDVADPRIWLLPGTRPGSIYWPVTFLSGLSAILFLAWRLPSSGRADRFRLEVFVGGMLLGLAPLFVEVLVEEAWPAYKALVHQPAIEPWMALLLFVPMALVPFVVAYSVLYDRVVATRVVLRTAAQYLLARATIITVSAVPFVALTIFLYDRRAESLVSLMAGTRPAILGLMVISGTLALRLRHRWLLVLDRRYFREQHDTEALVSHLMTGGWIAQAPASIAETLGRELEAVFHARADLFVLDFASGDLRHPAGDRPDLNANSALGGLLAAGPRPMDVRAWKDGPLMGLPAEERRWLDSGGYALLVPLRAGGTLAGVLALGGKRSELAYTEADRRALMGIGTAVALALENNRLRSSPDSQTTAAAECTQCARLLVAGTTACVCGGQVTEAAAPYILRGVYRFERRIGSGGMGVVYLARDLSLDRPVAIKTLPHVESRHEQHLRSEAQAMASIVDANLAVIYAIESWRGIPFLVEEYLESGTLADRLRRGPLDIGDALDLGMTLAGALDRLHAAGIIHCDVKPNNIGFARGGVPKLIDFGVARMLGSAGEVATVAEHSTGPAHDSTIITRHGLIGTPAYMSPEALKGWKPQPAFDLWALAVVLFEAIAGRRPFTGRDFSQVKAAVLSGVTPDFDAFGVGEGALRDFFVRCLALDPGRRPRDARAVRKELAALRAAAA